MTVLDHQEISTIIAALRFYQEYDQGNPDKRSNWIHNIATDGDSTVSLDDCGVSQLVDKLQTNGGNTMTEVEVLKQNSVTEESVTSLTSRKFNAIIKIKDRDLQYIRVSSNDQIDRFHVALTTHEIIDLRDLLSATLKELEQ